LKCIGELNPSQEALLAAMTPTLQANFSTTGTPDELVTERLHFPSNIRDSVNAKWSKNEQIAKQNGLTLVPMQFVEMFVANKVEDF